MGALLRAPTALTRAASDLARPALRALPRGVKEAGAAGQGDPEVAPGSRLAQRMAPPSARSEQDGGVGRPRRGGLARPRFDTRRFSVMRPLRLLSLAGALAVLPALAAP